MNKLRDKGGKSFLRPSYLTLGSSCVIIFFWFEMIAYLRLYRRSKEDAHRQEEEKRRGVTRRYFLPLWWWYFYCVANRFHLTKHQMVCSSIQFNLQYFNCTNAGSYSKMTCQCVLLLFNSFKVADRNIFSFRLVTRVSFVLIYICAIIRQQLFLVKKKKKTSKTADVS